MILGHDWKLVPAPFTHDRGRECGGEFIGGPPDDSPAWVCTKCHDIAFLHGNITKGRPPDRFRPIYTNTTEFECDEQIVIDIMES